MAGTTEIKVSSERLRSSMEVIKASADEFDGCMNQISGMIKSLEASWEGSASSEFASQFGKLKTNFDKYKEVITEQSVALRKAVEYYEDRERNITTETAKLDNSQLFA